MKQVDKFSHRLDEIFEQGFPTKALIIEAFHKANPNGLSEEKIDDYIKLFDDNRVIDADGDSGHTIHVNKAIEICQSIEIHYLNRIVEMAYKMIDMQNKMIKLQNK